MERDVNIQVRVEGRGGWIPMLQGESQGRALERILPEMNAGGYRVSFIIPDRPNLFWVLKNLVVMVCTLGFYWRSVGLIIIGERMDE